MNFTFKSLKSDQFAYEFDSNSYSYDHKGLHQNLLQYDTYGDGIIKHSNTYPVSSDNYVDCIYSFLHYLKGNIKTAIDMNFYLRDISRDSIKFFSSFKYDENKPYRYYSHEKLKVSSAESKRYDKRWHEIPTYLDGTPTGIRIILNDNFVTQYGEYFNGSAFDFLNVMVSMEEYLDDFSWLIYGFKNNICIHGYDTEQMYSLYIAFRAFWKFIKACRKLDFVFQQTEYYVRNLEKEDD